jgi:hypothetical protein
LNSGRPWPERRTADSVDGSDGPPVPNGTCDAEEGHEQYHDTTTDPAKGREDPEGSFFYVNDLEDRSKECERKFERFWRLHNGVHLDPYNNNKFGMEAQYYADDWVEMERVTATDRLRWDRPDAICQTMGVGNSIRDRVLTLMGTTDLGEYSNWEGADGAAVCFTALALAEHFGVEEIEEIQETDWWSEIESLANDIGLLGSTGRSFRQALRHTESNYGGELGDV